MGGGFELDMIVSGVWFGEEYIVIKLVRIISDFSGIAITEGRMVSLLKQRIFVRKIRISSNFELPNISM